MLKDTSLTSRKVILRTDYNVPLNDGVIQSTNRIDESLDTINYILSNKPKKLIIISHLGRPKDFDDNLTLFPIKTYLEKKLKKNIGMCKNFLIDDIPNNDIVMLDNIRYFKEETNNDNEFRKKLSNLGDVFVNDAFGCCHRAHASVCLDVKNRCFGFLVEKELKYLQDVFSNDDVKTLILGGSKINDKIKLIENLIPKVDNILVGGGMAFTFLKYKYNFDIGDSLFDEEGYNMIEDIINLCRKYDTNLYLPNDMMCADKFSNDANIKYVCLNESIPKGWMGLDIGLKTIKKFKNILSESKTIVWNGPLGVFEFDNFANGSKDIMLHMSQLKATTVIGGGDTTSCCEKFNCKDKMTHVSTGGGASLELLEGKQLPGITHIFC